MRVGSLKMGGPKKRGKGGRGRRRETSLALKPKESSLSLQLSPDRPKTHQERLAKSYPRPGLLNPMFR